MEEIEATILSINNTEFHVEIPGSEFWENNTEAKFIICFSRKIDKERFLKQCQSFRKFEMNCYEYTDLKVHSVWFSNMVRCRASKSIDSVHILENFFDDGVPF